MTVTVSKLMKDGCDMIEFSVSTNRHAVHFMGLHSDNIWNGSCWAESKATAPYCGLKLQGG